MRAEELRHRLDRRPFEAYRIHMLEGDKIDITHPGSAVVSRSLFAVAVGGRRGVGDYLVHYNLLHVRKIEPVRRKNGTTQRRRRRS